MANVAYTKDDLQYEFIESVCKRLWLLLPNRTGFTVAEVELNPQFITTKQILLNKKHHGMSDMDVDKDTRFISHVISSFCGILNRINGESNLIKLRDRNEKSLSSTLIILKLLADIIKHHWTSKRSIHDMKHEFFLSNCDVSSNYSMYFHYEPPAPLNPLIIRSTIDTLLSLLSPQVVRKVLSLLKSDQVEAIDLQTVYRSQNHKQTHHYNYTSSNTSQTATPNNELESDDSQNRLSLSPNHEYVDNYIKDIDYYIEVALRFIAASNPDDYYDYLVLKLFKYAEKGELVPLPVLQKYSPLVKHLFYQLSVAEKMAQVVYQFLPYIKSSHWKMVFMVFYANSIKDQCFSRPEDYIGLITPGSAIELDIRNLFDYISTVIDDSPYSSCSSMIHSWLSILCLTDFNEFESKPNKLRIAFNRRLKFVNGIIKDSNSGANLDCFDSLINIFHLGAALCNTESFSPEHPIYKFCLLYLDGTYENLTKLIAKSKNHRLTSLYDNLLVNFYIAALIIKPHTYMNVLINKFNESKDDMREVRILIKTVKGLSEFERTTGVFNCLMKKLATPLKSMILFLTRLLKQLENSSEEDNDTKYNDEDDRQQYSQPGGLSLDNYIAELSSSANTKINSFMTEDDDNFDDTSYISKLFSSIKKPNLILQAEEMLSDLFSIFVSAPELYFNDFELMNDSNLNQDETVLREEIFKFVYEVIFPLKHAMPGNNTPENSFLFESACSLIMSLVDKESLILKNRTIISTYANFLTALYIIQSICKACLSLSLTDARFKSCLLFLNKFLEARDKFSKFVIENKLIENHTSHSDCGNVFHSFEKILLLSLCTHDIQIYNIARISIKWYCKEINSRYHLNDCFPDSLAETFEKVVKDESVFTGFVSLHKKFRSILREAKPTRSLFQIWLTIYKRWLDMIEYRSTFNNENLVFRHFSGFLVSTSGCFASVEFSKDDPEQKRRSQMYISDFFDKCIGLLNSNDLVIRVVIKDALSMESHSAVFHIICTKLMNVSFAYADKKIVNEESVIFMEQVLVILTTMIGSKSDGTFVLASLLPDVCGFLIDFINLTTQVSDRLKLKLRFCRLGSALENDKKLVGLGGAYKLRNSFAKTSSEWLEQAVFFDEAIANEEYSDIPPISINIPTAANKDSEIFYLNIDLATECSKCLSLQLEGLLLEVPEGTKDKDLRKNKDLVFANYLSLFYRILQKYTSRDMNANLVKSKYKVQLITDNALKSITNILQYDTDIGLQFVFPLGYHDNNKIRAIFLNISANMLASRKLSESKEEFPDEILSKLTDLYELCGATAEVASLTDHNLLATSLFMLFGYTKKLDKLFKVLLNDEVDNVTRSSDIFRRNSTLTKLLSNFAKDYGLDYLSATLIPFIEELNENRVAFEVEKSNDSEEDTELFMQYFNQLVDVIINSIALVPASFKYICREIYNCVSAKFENAALISVGSFIFLRFFCPAIISPKTFFDISIDDMKVKRTLMQLVKVIQNMANGSLNLMKWPGLSSKMNELNALNQRIFDFLKDISTCSEGEYPFQEITNKPIPELRYLHKFFYNHFVRIKHHYILAELTNMRDLHNRIVKFRHFDDLVKELGQPKALISLQITTPYKSFDPNNNSSSQYNDFMSKMAMNSLESTVDFPVVHNSIFHDGTPAVVINFGYLKFINNDMHLLVFRLFELANQVWDNKFYLVVDFTTAVLDKGIFQIYVSLLSTYAPVHFFKNCSRVYYFNIPKVECASIMDAMTALRMQRPKYQTTLYTYSQSDSPSIVNSLCLSETTLSISRDNRVIFENVTFYNASTGKFEPVILRIGRQWFQICFIDFYILNGPPCATDGFMPIEIYELSDIIKCEISKTNHSNDEFVIYLAYGLQVTLRSHERSEILKSLYFTTSRLPKQLYNLEREGHESSSYHWFSRLYNVTFQGLLSDDEEVRAGAAKLFSSLSIYFDIDLGIPSNYAKNIAFPSNLTDFIVSTSEYLSKRMPAMSFRFFKAFFDYYDKLPHENRLNAILYISPWIDNVCDYIYLENDSNGPDRVADIVRQFCRISCLNKEQIAYLNDYVWKKLFFESRLTSVLVDEVVAFVIDNKNIGPDWFFIISLISPSIEVCGEVISRLISCIKHASTTDSAIATQSKLFEIRVLVKICATLSFNSNMFSQLFLADVFFVCTLFIDNPSFDFGDDLQKLFINTVQSFFHKADLTNKEKTVIENTLDYFSGQRARMLFGITRDKHTSRSELSQTYNRAASFEVLCEYLDDFITELGTQDDRSGWRSRWCTYAIDLVFSSTSLFQTRAILVVGILSKSGINDSTSSRVLKLLSRKDINSMDYLTNVSVSVSRIIEGLYETSVLPPVLIWPEVYFGLFAFSAVYQPSVQCVLSCVSKVVLKYNYLDEIFKNRDYLEPYISEFESSHNIHITKSNFDFYILFIFSHGLRLSHIKHTSLSCMKKYFKLRYKLRDNEEIKNYTIPNVCFPYLLLIYLSISDSTFETFLLEQQLEVGSCELIDSIKIPTVLMNFLLSDSKDSVLTFIHAAYLFANDTADSTYKRKFLHVYKHLFELNKEKGFLVYHIMRPEMEQTLINSSTTDIVNTISDVSINVISDEDYSIEKYQHKVSTLLEENQVTMIRDHKLIRVIDELETESGLDIELSKSVRNIQDLVYRSSCSYVEGHRLED